MKRSEIFLCGLRVLFGALFAYSGYQKLMSPSENLLAVIHSYDMLPNAAAVPFSIALPWVEFVAGVFLLAGLWMQLAIAALWLSNSAFIIALSQAILRKLPLGACGCFGDALTLSPKKTLLLDLALLAGFLILWRSIERAKRLSLDEAL